VEEKAREREQKEKLAEGRKGKRNKRYKIKKKETNRKTE